MTLMIRACALLLLFCALRPVTAHEGFVDTNGVRLQYLDWGGTGPALILVHGLGDNPHVFDDLAPAFTDRFHVIAYARRGSGSSDIKGPYDEVTLTKDLLGLMDALAIRKASLVGFSAGGVEITELAATHPERVERLVYFDGAYDGADPDLKALVGAFPQGFWDPPRSALSSLDAYLRYLQSAQFAGVEDMTRVEANVRQAVVIQPDGSLAFRTPPAVIGELYSALYANKPRDYKRVRCPALALYAAHFYETRISDRARREQLLAFEQRYWRPFQEKSIALVRRDLANAEIVRVPGTHTTFFLTAREQVVAAMRRFLIS